jgi:hypothetical protein
MADSQLRPVARLPGPAVEDADGAELIKEVIRCGPQACAEPLGSLPPG